MSTEAVAEPFSALVERVRASRLPRPAERRRIRQAARLTYRDMASVLGVDPMTVLRWERGVTPRPEHAVYYRRLLDALETALEEASA